MPRHYTICNEPMSHRLYRIEPCVCVVLKVNETPTTRARSNACKVSEGNRRRGRLSESGKESLDIMSLIMCKVH